ncbi:MAG: D-alanine--D-alanine ligase [Gammaproteobacteria bacterium]|nr:D-alanine--D-alanine ligase [Gammaproteobacteria bacterium]
MGTIVTLQQQDSPSPQAFGKVAVLMGGWSAEREISLKSGNAVLAALQQRGVNAHGIDVQRETVLQTLAQGNFDRVFIVLHGPGGEDGVIQGALEILGLPYTGSGVMASALSMDKLRTKQLLEGANLPTPRYMLMDQDADLNYVVAELGLPLMVKPALEGSSIGMTKVEEENQLAAAYQLAAQYEGQVFAEQWIVGKEYTVAILGEEALPVIRLETPHKFYDYDAKYFANDTKYHCPCGLPLEQEAQLQRLALSAFKAVGAEGWGRVDILCDQAGKPYIIELNTVPGMTDHSLVPMAARVRGIAFDELVYRILQQTMTADRETIAEADHGRAR